MARIGKSPRDKLRAGNAGGRPLKIAKAAARAIAAAPIAPPDWLADKEARAIWSRIAPTLHGLRYLSAGEVDAFGRYCFHFAEWLRLLRLVAKQGDAVETPMTGHTADAPKMMMRLNPLVKRIEQHESRLVELEDRFGGTPLARHRLGAMSAARPGMFAGLFDDEPTADKPASETPAAPSNSPFGFLLGERPN